MRRLPIVGVMGSGDDGHESLATPLGRMLAAEGVHLLTGGGGGVMASVARAFCEVSVRQGQVIGVLPAGEPGLGEPPPGYPNDFVEIAIRTHLMARGPRGDEADSRNHVNVLSSHVVVALPGGEGTASEVRLAQRYGRPLLVHAASRDAIPGLAEDVRVERELSEVRAFLRSALAGSQI